MGVDGGTHERSLSDKVTAVYVSTCNNELLYDVLPTKRCSKVKGRVALVVEDRVDIEGKGRIWGEFAKRLKNRTWIILSADGSDELCMTRIPKNRRVAQKGRFRGEAERKGVGVYAVNRVAIRGRGVRRTGRTRRGRVVDGCDVLKLGGRAG